MKALVTGGAGFIGSSIAAALVDRGDQVTVLDNLATGFEENIPKGADFVEGDLRNPADVSKACEGAEVVFHQAAIRSVPKSVDDPMLSTDANVIGTLQLLIGAKDASVKRLVYASSSSVYGDTDAEINQEDAAPNPRSPYAVSKLAAEYYCGVWTHLYGLSTVSLRYFNVFGPGQRPDSKYSNVFPGFIEALQAGRAPEIHWDGEQTRDFTYIGDVVDANLRAAGAGPDADGQVFNIGGGHDRSVNEVLKAVSDELGKWIDPEFSPKRAGDVRRTFADISRADKILGWQPKTPWKDAVSKTVAWFEGR